LLYYLNSCVIFLNFRPAAHCPAVVVVVVLRVPNTREKSGGILMENAAKVEKNV